MLDQKVIKSHTNGYLDVVSRSNGGLGISRREYGSFSDICLDVSRQGSSHVVVAFEDFTHKVMVAGNSTQNTGLLFQLLLDRLLSAAS